MASFASSATTCGARKHAWTNNNYPSNQFHNCTVKGISPSVNFETPPPPQPLILNQYLEHSNLMLFVLKESFLDIF